MTRHNIHVIWQVLLKRSFLWGLDRGLPRDDSIHLRGFAVSSAKKVERDRKETHTGSILLHHPLDELSFYRIHHEIRRPRHGVSINKDGDPWGIFIVLLEGFVVG